jgi:hypothetical protein
MMSIARYFMDAVRLKSAFIIAILISICGQGLFAQGEEENNLPIDKEKIGSIEAVIKARNGWNSDEYTLELRADWNHEKLPLIVAIPLKRKIDWSPKFFVLPDNSVVSPNDEKGLEKILTQVFSVITEQDAQMLAELSLAFGIYGRPVGVLFQGSVEGRLTPEKIPRKDALPVLVKSDDVVTIKFYSYDYELLYLYDCTFTITGSTYKGDVVKLN